MELLPFYSVMLRSLDKRSFQFRAGEMSRDSDPSRANPFGFTRMPFFPSKTKKLVSNTFHAITFVLLAMNRIRYLPDVSTGKNEYRVVNTFNSDLTRKRSLNIPVIQ